MLELMLILQVTTVQQQANWSSVAMSMITALPATIAAIVAGMALLQSRRNAEVAAVTDHKVDKTDAKADVIIEKATEIHTLTNSNLAKVTAALEMANQKLEQFQSLQVKSDSRMRKLEDVITKLIPNQDSGTSAKLDQLGKDLASNTATGDRIEAANVKTADDLAASQKRASDVSSDEAGAAADAAVRPEKAD